MILFLTKRKDEFEIECPSVGELTKIRIGHNNKGVAPGNLNYLSFLFIIIYDFLIIYKMIFDE